MKEKLNIQQNPKIKILIAYHKPAVLLKDEILTPIHLGRALATQASKDGTMSEADYAWMCENMIGDDTGENISHLNRYLNELTGIYWAWKNYDKLDSPDYIGFMHYRRVFDFSGESKNLPVEHLGCANIDFLSMYNKDDYLATKDILKTLKECPYLISQAYDINPYKQFAKEHNIEDYDLALQILDEKFPEFSQAAKVYNEGDTSYFCNMFVLPREEFFRYCEFIFGIVLEAFEQIKLKLGEKSFLENRVCAFFSERLTAIYFINLKLNHKNFKELPIIYIHHTDLAKELHPTKKEQITLAFAINDTYALYFPIVIHSLLEHLDKKHFCEIFIFYERLNEQNQKKIKLALDEFMSTPHLGSCFTSKLTQSKDKKSLENSQVKFNFIDIRPYLSEIDFKKLLFESYHVTRETYFRIFIPRVLKNFSRVLYLDTDIIILKDIAPLFYTPLAQDEFVAAAKDMNILYFIYAKNKDIYLDKSIRLERYLKDFLGLKNLSFYFNAGIMLFDIQKCLEFELEKKALQKLEALKQPIYWDQDILNATLQDHVKELEMIYNFQQDESFYKLEKVPLKLEKEYKDAEEKAVIIHYISDKKPWCEPYFMKAFLWWAYARKSPFYEEILFRNVHTYKPYGALERFKNQLSYKLGSELLSVKTRPLKTLALPFSLVFLMWQAKKDRKLSERVDRARWGADLTHLKHYADYGEALSAKQHLAYRLGSALLKNPLTFGFKIRSIYRQWRKDKKGLSQ